MAYKTPGVYIVEKNAFPNSVVEVATAVPAFIGYTQKADNKGSPLQNKAWRITSMSEYHNYFGFAPDPKFTINDAPADPNDESDFSLAGTQFYLSQDSVRYQLYYSMMLFFQNGGGACYVVSVGGYADAIDAAQLTAGIDVLVKEQEPTMVVIPDAIAIGDADVCNAIQQAALAHCGKLKNRFAILDVYDGFKDRQDPSGDCIEAFRGRLGINNLDYAAAYYPWLNTTIVQDGDLSYGVISNADKLQQLIQLDIGLPLAQPVQTVAIQVDKAGTPITKIDAKKMLSVLAADNSLIAVSADGKAQLAVEDPTKLKIGVADSKGLTVIGDGNAYPVTVADKTTLNIAGADGKALPVVGGDGLALPATTKIVKLTGDVGNPLKVVTDNGSVCAVVLSKDGKTAVVLNGKVPAAEPPADAVDVSKTHGLTIAGQALSLTVDDKPASLLSSGGTYTLTGTTTSATPDQAKKSTAVANITKVWEDDTSIRPDDIPGNITTLDKTLRAISPVYNNVLLAVKKRLNLLPPSAAMAGIYTLVDNSRGVWKAPANVSLNSVVSPTVNISQESQEDLNVTTAGKSINAIRTFIGEGTLVWGGRTLDGNSLDWRYINVRRTMIMLEESIRLASKAYVFEPNVANTWVTIKSMIRNFLTGIWKRGGLAGASPDDAFGVFVGLGETMTPDDILEGILRVTVLVALSRPAEFIEITFQQQMQKS
ncbi:MAG TPA: phage tail sheath C-terminal domain-containing protein [Burkholderiaceae bacterium]